MKVAPGGRHGKLHQWHQISSRWGWHILWWRWSLKLQFTAIVFHKKTWFECFLARFFWATPCAGSWQVPWPSCRMTSRMLCSNPCGNIHEEICLAIVLHFLLLGITMEASGVLKLMNVIWLLFWVLSASFEPFEDSKKQTWSCKKHSSVSPVWFWVGYWLFYPASYFLKVFF